MSDISARRAVVNTDNISDWYSRSHPDPAHSSLLSSDPPVSYTHRTGNISNNLGSLSTFFSLRRIEFKIQKCVKLNRRFIFGDAKISFSDLFDLLPFISQSNQKKMSNDSIKSKELRVMTGEIEKVRHRSRL